MASPLWPVLYEDNHLLVVNKPAMLPTMGVPDDRASLIQQAREYLKQKYAKPGNVYLGIVSRLDAPVTGLIVLARTSKAAARLTEQFRTGAVEKTYWAIVSGAVRPGDGRLVDYVRKDERHRRVDVAQADSPDAKQAVLTYCTRGAVGQRTWLEVRLETGRKHQIRVQLAHAGHPIVGDRKYGSRERFASGIALHSRKLIFEHPVRRDTLELIAPVPPAWDRFNLPLE